MLKILLRTFTITLLILVLITSYLSIFGVKTNKFNDLIKLQITKQDNRANIELEDVFVKLNLIEGSFSLKSQNLKLLIHNESQEIESAELLISLKSIIGKENKIKKIIINSKKNKIIDFLKFIRAYRINIPALYLENSVTNGSIIYNITINSTAKEIDKLNISGKIIDTDLNILGKEKIEDTNLEFNYKNKELNLTNLKIKYKKTDFVSDKISIIKDNNLIYLSGDFKNKVNVSLISNFLDFNLKKYIDEKTSIISKSDFEIILNSKFKINDYKLRTKIDFDEIKIKLDNIILEDYIPAFDRKIILKKGDVTISFNKKKETFVKINSKYILNEKDQPREILLDYSNVNSIEKYQIYLDLTDHALEFDQFDFYKKKKEEFFLDSVFTQKKNNLQLEYLKFFNKKNRIYFQNIKFGKNFKIKNFELIEAKYVNKYNFLNDINLKKTNNNIQLNSNNFDMGSIIKKSLSGKDKKNFLDIFQNLNSTLNINIKSAKLDEDHNLNNIKGKSKILKNKIGKTNITAEFDQKNNFTFTKDIIDGKIITIILSDYAKPFVKKFDFIKGFEDGKIDYTSTEINETLSKSELRIYDFKLKDMPALTKLLSLASLQGIADLATGQGIRFSEFDMYFESSKNLITIKEIYALGPAISILMEGYVEKNKLVSLRGTMVPATTINKTIAKIPLLGNILVGDETGEGVFGVSFKIKGPPDKLDTRVNPIKTLTPRFITRTLEKIKKSN